MPLLKGTASRTVLRRAFAYSSLILSGILSGLVASLVARHY
jgi:hypothetical protein